MKKFFIYLLVVMLILAFSNSSSAQCPEDTIDLGICDTVYVEAWAHTDTCWGGDCDVWQINNPGSHFPCFLYVNVFVTHDSNTFDAGPPQGWIQDSIASFTVPLVFWHQPVGGGDADSVIFPKVTSGPDQWNNTRMDPPGHVLYSKSMFRHFVDSRTDPPDTVYYNRFNKMVNQDFLPPWTITDDIDRDACSGDSGYVRMSLLAGASSPSWWESTKELLYTMTFIVYMDDAETTEVCFDAQFWPPGETLSFVRYDAVFYYPRDNLPYCFQIGPPPDFTISATPDTYHVQAGQSANYQVILTSQFGFSSPCTLTATGLPDDASAEFDPNPAVPTDTSLFTIGTAETTPYGAYDITITATELGKAEIEHSTQVVLIVTPPPDFTIDVEPDTLTVFSGDSGDYAVILTSINGFASPCTLTVVGHPDGSTPDFDPPVLVPTDSSILAIAIPDTTTPDTFTLTVTATEMDKGKGIAHSKDVILIVIGPDFTIHAYPDTQFVHAGQDTNYYVILTSLLGFNSLCTLTVTGIPPDGVVSFDPDIMIPTDSSLMTVQTAETILQGIYDLIIAATELGKAKIEHSTQVVLSVSRPDTLWIIAYSPVDLIVTDPVGDSIGLEFNTIEDADYDTTVDWNEDGDSDDLITIPHPFVGEYQIRVIREDGAPDTVTYDLGIRINGSAMDMLADDETLPPPDGSSNYGYDCLTYLRGDANGDNQTNSADIIFLINYLFKSGPAPDPLELGYVNCGDEVVNSADVVYLIDYLFKGGPPPCS